jgi:hypothetical protein
MAAHLHQLVQEFQLFPVVPGQSEITVLLVPQSGNVVAIIREVYKSCYCLSVNQYKVLLRCVSTHLLECECPLQTRRHRSPSSSYKEHKLELWNINLAAHLLKEGTGLRRFSYLKDV